MKTLTIGKLAEAVGVGVETVRYYQRKALLSTPERTGGIRRYSSEDVRQLRFIREAQKAGFTLEEIRELIALDASRDHQRVYELAARRIEKLEQRISEMQRARDCLARLANECASDHSRPCPILGAFEVQETTRQCGD